MGIVKVKFDPNLARARRQGYNLDAFHGTRGNITEMDPNHWDVGFHVGPRHQAENRLAHTRPGWVPGVDTPATPDERILELRVRANSPLETRDAGGWSEPMHAIQEVTRALPDDKVLRKLRSEIAGDHNLGLKGPEAKRAYLQRINERLRELGYDSIRYKNDWENAPDQGSEAPYLRQSERDQVEREINAIRAQQPKPRSLREITNEVGDPKLAMRQFQNQPTGVLDPRIEQLEERLRSPLLNERADPYSHIILDPTGVRRTDAAFLDPSSRNLLKSIGGTGLLASSLLYPEDEAEAGRIRRFIENPGRLFPEDNVRIAQRYPVAGKTEKTAAMGDPLTEDLPVDLQTMYEAPKAKGRVPFTQNIRLMDEYPQFSTIHGRAPERAEAQRDFMADNIKWLHDQIPPEIQEQTKLWYDGANKMATQFAGNYGYSDVGTAGAIAALSPQKGWFENVSMAERMMDILSDPKKLTGLDENGISHANRIYGGKAPDAADLDDLRAGKPFDQLSPNGQAMYVRSWSEANHTPHYRLSTPDGTIVDWARGQKGNKSNISWQSNGNIAKAIDVLQNPSLENISEKMGKNHKVRNFYNNIIDPNATRGDVTIDTHAGAAAHLEPFASEDVPIKRIFGGEGTSTAGHHGAKGEYGLYADAYRQAAEEVDRLPREVQSITWEAIKSLFPDSFKKSGKAKIRKVWDEYADGVITLGEAREKILETARGFKNPDWYDPNEPLQNRKAHSDSTLRGLAALFTTGAGLGALAPEQADAGTIDSVLAAVTQPPVEGSVDSVLAQFEDAYWNDPAQNVDRAAGMGTELLPDGQGYPKRAREEAIGGLATGLDTFNKGIGWLLDKPGLEAVMPGLPILLQGLQREATVPYLRELEYGRRPSAGQRAEAALDWL